MDDRIQQTSAEWATSRQFTIRNMSAHKMHEILGEPNIKDDPNKVNFSWGVQQSNEAQLAIWDYKCPFDFKRWAAWVEPKDWSAWGSRELAEKLFGVESVSS